MKADERLPIATASQYNKFSLFDFSFEFYQDVYFLGGIDWRLFSDDEYARDRSVSGATLPLHRSSEAGCRGFVNERRDRARAVHRFPFHRRAAVRVLSSVYRSRLRFGNIRLVSLFTGGDRVFPDFITRHLPTGLSGLVVAAIFAAAMSSSLNSIAATAVNDLYKPLRPRMQDKHYLKVSHILTLLWGVVQIGVALVLRNQNRSALDLALSIASLINGPILGAFLVGTFLKRVSQTPALIAMLVSLGIMLYIYFATAIAWTWYVFIGSVVTFVVAWLVSFAFHRVRRVAAINSLPMKAKSE